MKIILQTNLKMLLQNKGITPAKLSRDTKIPPQTLNNWLSGHEPRSLIQLRIVADYFNVSVDYLVYGIKITDNILEKYENEINAGVFEVILRRKKL